MRTKRLVNKTKNPSRVSRRLRMEEPSTNDNEEVFVDTEETFREDNLEKGTEAEAETSQAVPITEENVDTNETLREENVEKGREPEEEIQEKDGLKDDDKAEKDVNEDGSLDNIVRQITASEGVTTDPVTETDQPNENPVEEVEKEKEKDVEGEREKEIEGDVRTVMESETDQQSQIPVEEVDKEKEKDEEEEREKEIEEEEDDSDDSEEELDSEFTDSEEEQPALVIGTAIEADKDDPKDLTYELESEEESEEESFVEEEINLPSYEEEMKLPTYEGEFMEEDEEPQADQQQQADQQAEEPQAEHQDQQQQADQQAEEPQAEQEQDNAPALILNYSLRTVMDECGNPPAQITFREKLGNVVGFIKEVVVKKKLQNLIVSSGLGHFLEVNEKNWKKGSGNLLHFFLLRQIKCNKKKELWFLVGNKPIKFGFREFCLITGLRCGPYPDQGVVDQVLTEGVDFALKVKDWVLKQREKEQEKVRKETEKKKKVKGKKGGKGGEEKNNGKKKFVKSESCLYSDELKDIIMKSGNVFSASEKAQCAAMYFVHALLLGEHETKPLDQDLLCFTVNQTFFGDYPWGRLAYEKLLDNLNRNFEKKTEKRKKLIQDGAKASIPVKYTIAGFWQSFIVWAYEAVDRFGVDLGFRSTENPDAIPRLLRWHCTGYPKMVHIDKLELKVAGDQVSCIPMLRPSEEELQRSYWQGFEDMVDSDTDDTIDHLAIELADVAVLRPVDGIDRSFIPNETEEHIPSPVSRTAGPDYDGDMGGGSGFTPAIPSPPPTRSDRRSRGVGDEGRIKRLEDELCEVKKALAKLTERFEKNASNSTNPVIQPRQRRVPAWLLSPSWTLEGKKRKRSKPEEISRRFAEVASGKKRKMSKP